MKNICNKLKKASVLVVALWSLAFLGFVSVCLGYSARQELILLKRITSRNRLRFLASSGIYRAIDFIGQEAKKEKKFRAFKEDWGNNPSYFKQMKLEGGWVSVGYTWHDEQSQMSRKRYGLIDEERKINIRPQCYLTKTRLRVMLERLFMLVACLSEREAQDVAASIIDWQDEDSQLLIPTGSAESTYYGSLPLEYECKDRTMDIIEELLLVKGVNKELFDTIKNYVTLYGDGAINVNTASPQVLLAAGLASTVVEKIVALRRGEDEVEGSQDDTVFTNTAEIASKLSQRFSLDSSELSNISAVIEKGLLTTSSHYFMIQAQSFLSNAQETMRVMCVINTGGEILYWREP